jgi:hypothetical protein
LDGELHAAPLEKNIEVSHMTLPLSSRLTMP